LRQLDRRKRIVSNAIFLATATASAVVLCAVVERCLCWNWADRHRKRNGAIQACAWGERRIELPPLRGSQWRFGSP